MLLQKQVKFGNKIIFTDFQLWRLHKIIWMELIIILKMVVMNGRLINQKELKDFDKNNIKKYIFSL